MSVARYLPAFGRVGGIAPMATSTDTYSYWFTSNWSSGQTQYVSDYTTWTFYKINGSSTHFFVKVQGSAQAKWPYILTRFEPWLMRSGGTSTLGNWDPTAQVVVNDGQQVQFSVTYGILTFSTAFYATSQSYNPYSTSSMFSLEWRGAKTNASVGNNAVERWYNANPSQMLIATCGKVHYYPTGADFTWGVCSNRSR